MGKMLFHIYLPFILEEKGFVRNFQKTSPFISLSRESHEGPSEQVWRPKERTREWQQRKGVDVRTEQIDQASYSLSLPPLAAGSSSLSISSDFNLSQLEPQKAFSRQGCLGRGDVGLLRGGNGGWLLRTL